MNTSINPGTWNIDPGHSEIGFAVRHLGLSKVRGRFKTFSGTLTIQEDNLVSEVIATIDLSSIDTNNAQRDGHLQSTDFFNLASHPTMTFISAAVKPNTMSGNLTINGVTNTVTLDLEFHGVTNDAYGQTRAGFSASGVIKRSDFGIDFNAPVGLDGLLISDSVTIELEIQAVAAS